MGLHFRSQDLQSSIFFFGSLFSTHPIFFSGNIECKNYMNTKATEWCQTDGQLMDSELMVLPQGLKTVL